MKKLNELITDARKLYKVSRKGVSNVSGFNERTIGAYERGELTIPQKYLSFISIYFNIKLECFEKGIVSDVGYTGNDKKYGKRYDNCNMNKKRLVVERYKAIHNLSTDGIVAKIGSSKRYGKFEEFFEDEKIGIEKYKNEISDLSYYVELCKKLKIKPSSFGFELSEDNTYLENSEVSYHNTYYYIDVDKEIEERYKLENEQRKKDLEKLFEYENNEDFLLYDEEYYLSVIKARNNPNNVYVPTEKELLPPKYKEIIELLPYAPDSFIENLKKKLQEMKKAQQLDDL